jgi:hypothetical protein
VDQPIEAARLHFERLDALRVELEGQLAAAGISLAQFSDPSTAGFYHRLSTATPGDPSRASSATCVAFLVQSGRWDDAQFDWHDRATTLAQALAQLPWTSAELPNGNAFTVSFLLDALHHLGKTASNDSAHWPAHAQLVRNWVDSNAEALDRDFASHSTAAMGESMVYDPEPPSLIPEDPIGTGSSARIASLVRFHIRWLGQRLVAFSGGLSIADSPPTAFLTYKAVRALEAWGALTPTLRETARSFAQERMYRESVAIASGTRDVDAFELGYAALVFSRTTSLVDMTPTERDALRHSLRQFFDRQDDAGGWSRSRPLFNYPSLGSAYCYDYEFLTSLLEDRNLHPYLTTAETELTKAFAALERSATPLGADGAVGWASGHLNPKQESPESWATASAYHFCLELRRFIVDQIRQQLFIYTRSPMPPLARPAEEPYLDSGFLDADIPLDTGERISLRSELQDSFLAPILGALDRVDQGHGLGDSVPNSAILYGPPGTSKTRLARSIAKVIGWPLLSLDPSHLTRDGYDRLHAETNILFTMLAAAERVVVLLDEFDELVQDRDQSDDETSSRFLTTAMLPKIAELAERRRIVYLLATNHIERFDDAISRAGRFDLVLPVMPPRFDEKIKANSQVATKIDELFGASKVPLNVIEALGDLTFLEFNQFASKACSVADQAAFLELMERAKQAATLNKAVGDSGTNGKPETWKQRILAETKRNRLTGP